MKKLTFILCLLAVCMTGPVSAQEDVTRYMEPADRFNKALHFLLGTQGEEKSPATAFRIFEDLAEQDFAAAQHMLATLYEKGNGVEQDLPKAWYWYQRAADNGFVSSESRLASLEKRMTTTQRQQAEQQLIAQGY